MSQTYHVWYSTAFLSFQPVPRRSFLHLNWWQLCPSIFSDEKPWSHPWLLLLPMSSSSRNLVHCTFRIHPASDCLSLSPLLPPWVKPPQSLAGILGSPPNRSSCFYPCGPICYPQQSSQGNSYNTQDQTISLFFSELYISLSVKSKFLTKASTAPHGLAELAFYFFFFF